MALSEPTGRRHGARRRPRVPPAAGRPGRPRDRRRQLVRARRARRAPAGVRLRGRPVLHLPGAGRRPAAPAVLLDVVLAGGRRRAAGHGEADAGRRGVELDERPAGRGRHPRGDPAGRRLPPRPGRRGRRRLQRRERHHARCISLLKTALATTSRPVRLLYANRDRDAVIFACRARRPRARRTATASSVSHHLDVDRGLVGARRRPLTSPSGDRDAGVLRLRARARSWTRRAGAARAAASLGGPDPHRAVHPDRAGAEPDPPVSTAVASQVTIELDGRTDTTDHRPGTTILQTARQMGMSPPFSCEAGSCATCMARLVEGTATMHVNNALTDDEVADGWVLTCQAVPTSPSGARRLRGRSDERHRRSTTSSRSSSCWPATPSA